MPNQNERERHIAMMRAALPYVSPQSRHSMEILLQANSLINLAMQPQTPELTGYSLDENENGQAFTPNPEAMLMNIREYCTPKEADTIQILLNFIHADRLFKSYREFANSHPDMPKADEINAGTTPLNTLFQLINGLGSLSGGINKSDNSHSNFMMQFLMSQLSPEQKETFENLQNIMQTT